MRRGREQWQEMRCQSAGRAGNAYEMPMGMPMTCVFVTGRRHYWRGDGDRLIYTPAR